MLVTDIDLHPFGYGDPRTLVRIVIVNDGTGDHYYGNYKFVISHQSNFHKIPDGHTLYLSAFYPDRLPKGVKPVRVWRQGEVKEFSRSRGATRLLGRCLKEAGLT